MGPDGIQQGCNFMDTPPSKAAISFKETDFCSLEEFQAPLGCWQPIFNVGNQLTHTQVVEVGPLNISESKLNKKGNWKFLFPHLQANFLMTYLTIVNSTLHFVFYQTNPLSGGHYCSDLGIPLMFLELTVTIQAVACFYNCVLEEL